MTQKTTWTIPPYAILSWIEGRDLIVALPLKDGGHYFSRYPLSEGGLSKALHAMQDLRTKTAVITGDHKIALPQPPIKRQNTLPDSKRGLIDEILKKHGF